MARARDVDRGAIVTYVNSEHPHRAPHIRGVATGTGIADPNTGHTWVPVLRPDRLTALVDSSLITEILPPAQVRP